MVDRTTDPADRRRVLVSLTDRAIAHGRRIHDLRRTQARAALDTMPPDERECFVRSIRSLAAALESDSVHGAG
jgi:DNA-binding MarR family transcriptional regulator